MRCTAGSRYRTNPPEEPQRLIRQRRKTVKKTGDEAPTVRQTGSFSTDA